MDDAAPLSGQRRRRPVARPAIQEPAQTSLDGRGAARQARHAHGRGARPRAQRSRDRSGGRRVPRDWRPYRLGAQQQVGFDLDAFTRATGRELTEGEKDRFGRGQLQADRWTYLGSAMTHERVLATLESLSPAARKRIEEIAPAFR